VATTAAPPADPAAAAAISPWAQLQHSYANATGHAPVYAQWTSSFWQCQNRYHNQSPVMDVARGYISRGYPVRALLLTLLLTLLLALLLALLIADYRPPQLSLIIIDYFSWPPSPLGNETLRRHISGSLGPGLSPACNGSNENAPHPCSVLQ